MAAAWALRLLFSVNFEKRAVLFVERVFVRLILAANGLDGMRKGRAHGTVQRLAFICFERADPAQRPDARFEEDFVRIRIADAAEEYLIAEHIFDLTAVFAQPPFEFFAREMRIERVRAYVVVRGNVCAWVVGQVDPRHLHHVDEAQVHGAGKLQCKSRPRQSGSSARAIGEAAAEHWVDDQFRPAVRKRKFEKLSTPRHAVKRAPRKVASKVGGRIPQHYLAFRVDQNGQHALTHEVTRERGAQQFELGKFGHPYV